MNKPNENESLVAAIEGNWEGMSKADLILTCKMLTNGRKLWMDEANILKARLDEAENELKFANMSVDGGCPHSLGNHLCCKISALRRDSLKLKEAEKDVKRFSNSQTDLIRAVCFFSSCIKSGEKWTDVCQEIYDQAIKEGV